MTIITTALYQKQQWVLLFLLLFTLMTRHCASFCPRLGRRTSALSAFASVTNADFDFSSQQGWENFYNSDDSDSIVEWHSSIPHQSLIDAYIPLGSSCLVVGCGNSQLPRAIYDSHHSKQQHGTTTQEQQQIITTKITCLDSSSTCLNQLRRQFDNCSHDVIKAGTLSLVCGDAVELTKTLRVEDDDSSSSFDIIIDKGLTDAILCGEGWNTPIKRLMQESIQVLKKNAKSSKSHYLLVSYQLPPSTQEFLQEVTAPHFEWSFGRPEGNTRVQVSLATMTNEME